MAASVMSAPAALVFAKIIWPETEEPATRGTLKVRGREGGFQRDRRCGPRRGRGLHLAMNVGAMLLAFIALIALINALLGWIGGVTNITGFFQNIGWLARGAAAQPRCDPRLAARAARMADGRAVGGRARVGTLLGIKTAVNEFVAYLQLSAMLSGDTELSPRSVVIATYALCGFANFSSIAIQIGGIGGIAPSRRSDLARIGLRAMIAGSLAAFMTATIAGILV
jgi:concentrative nucleoside transporter, CNT family